MSPVILQRFLVTGFDYDVWHIVVEAATREEAIHKAEAVYFADGFGKTDAFEHRCSYVDWKAEPLAREAQS